MNMNYRNPKLTKFAQDKPCTLKIAGVCNGDPATSVWAHSNLLRHGHGTAIKSHDLFGCIACSSCHDWLDNGSAERASKEELFLYAWERSMIMACEAGVLRE